jgi:four helix bundle protein
MFVKTLPNTLANIEDGKQLIKASRKEAKESGYWLRLIAETNELNNKDEAQRLIQENTELKKIFSAILEKSK